MTNCVLLAKPKVEGKVNDVAVQINESAELRTKFSGIPKPTIAWFVHLPCIDGDSSCFSLAS